MPWTKKRLEEVARTRLNGAKLIVVANREPFIHVYDGEEIRLMKPASSSTTALDPVMQVCQGTCVAHGSGDADCEVSDEKERVAVPPENPTKSLSTDWVWQAQQSGH